MSATELAAFVVAAVLAAQLAGVAAVLVYRAEAGQRARFGLCAAGLGLLAIIIFGVGASLGSDDVAVDRGRCEPGTYDNGGLSTDGPVCMPWPS